MTPIQSTAALSVAFLLGCGLVLFLSGPANGVSLSACLDACKRTGLAVWDGPRSRCECNPPAEPRP